MGREQLQNPTPCHLVSSITHLVSETRNGIQRFDGGKMPSGGELSTHHHVAVKNAAGGISHWLIHVIAFDQNGVHPSDRAATLQPAGPLEQLRQE